MLRSKFFVLVGLSFLSCSIAQAQSVPGERKAPTGDRYAKRIAALAISDADESGTQPHLKTVAVGRTDVVSTTINSDSSPTSKARRKLGDLRKPAITSPSSSMKTVPVMENIPVSERAEIQLDESCGCEKKNCDAKGCDGSCGSGFRVFGWISQGFTGNPDDPANNSNLPLTFNDRANEYMANQVYFGIEKMVDACGWDIGGRLDVLYGTDYFFTQATGLETHRDGTNRWNGTGPRGAAPGSALYGLAIPQAYMEFGTPILGGTSFKVGHFYTILGNESVMAPENFFYSHSYTMQYGEPFTHTGILANTQLANGLSVSAGITRGWDNWEDPIGTTGFLGGYEWTSADGRSTAAFGIHIGDDNQRGSNRTISSSVFTHRINCCWTYIFQSDYGVEENVVVGGGRARWYGVNQYLLHSINDCLSSGLRVEWFRDQDNARVLGIPIPSQTSGGNYFAVTAGLNWKPTYNLTIRPELRWDHSDVTGPANRRMFNDFQDTDQFTMGLDIILSL